MIQPNGYGLRARRGVSLRARGGFGTPKMKEEGSIRLIAEDYSTRAC